MGNSARKRPPGGIGASSVFKPKPGCTSGADGSAGLIEATSNSMRWPATICQSCEDRVACDDPFVAVWQNACTNERTSATQSIADPLVSDTQWLAFMCVGQGRQSKLQHDGGAIVAAIQAPSTFESCFRTITSLSCARNCGQFVPVPCFVACGTVTICAVDPNLW